MNFHSDQWYVNDEQRKYDDNRRDADIFHGVKFSITPFKNVFTTLLVLLSLALYFCPRFSSVSSPHEQFHATD